MSLHTGRCISGGGGGGYQAAHNKDAGGGEGGGASTQKHPWPTVITCTVAKSDAGWFRWPV